MKTNKYVPFKHKYDFEERIQKFQNQIKSDPDKVPIIVEPSVHSKLSPLINPRFCMMKDKNLTYLKVTLKDRISQAANAGQLAQQGLFFYAGKQIIGQGTETIQSFYNKHKDSDGFLYLTYSQLQVF